jgi:hypothetical protein
MAHDSPHPPFREKVQASFDRQGLMKALNGRLTRIDPGRVEIELPYSDLVTQQHGYFHAIGPAYRRRCDSDSCRTHAYRVRNQRLGADRQRDRTRRVDAADELPREDRVVAASGIP